MHYDMVCCYNVIKHDNNCRASKYIYRYTFDTCCIQDSFPFPLRKSFGKNNLLV